MALFVKGHEERSKLQERLDAELQERRKTSEIEQKPDNVEDSAYLKDTKDASSLSWAWVLIAVAVVIVAGYLIYIMTS